MRFLLLLLPLALAFTPPPNDGFLTDGAGILTVGEELKIEDMLQEYAKLTGTEIAVIIVRNVGEESMEDAAKDIAERWRVGIDGEARGMVVLFSYEDHDLFMVIGDGLRGIISSDIAQGIVEHDIVPLFRKGRYADGIQDGIESVMKHISGQYTSERYESSPPSQFAVWSTSLIGIAGGIVMILLVRQWWRRDPYTRRQRRRAMSP